MRFYQSFHELISETARNLWEMGITVKPKTYQNINIEGNNDYVTKELICESYALNCDGWRFVRELYELQSEEETDINIKWCSQEFNERITENINPGEAWTIRENVWDNLFSKHRFANILTGNTNPDGTPERKHVRMFDYTYSERICYTGDGYELEESNLDKVINILRNDPGTRRAIIPIYDLHDTQNISEDIRIPCSMYYSFMIRDDSKGTPELHMTYKQRSCDFVTHFPNDVLLAIKMMEYVHNMLMWEMPLLRMGYLYHTMDSLHIYQKDWEKVHKYING